MNESYTKFHASEELGKSDYNDRRLKPRLDDQDYLHLSDLRLALEYALPAIGSRVLDYGCGGSPYRPLFIQSTYHRADIPGIDGIDFVFSEDSCIKALDSDYDCVLSTQVLEHVAEVPKYLGECFRVLKPGGRLILTTHGTYNDHGCPYDFRRWTAEGLRMDVANVGFEIESVAKLTTGGRAIVYLNTLFNHLMIAGGGSWPALLMRLSRFFYSRVCRRDRHRFMDSIYSGNRVVPSSDEGHSIYIALILIARKPL